jgi:glycosyltransferase involved in cell wall biosynthesis
MTDAETPMSTSQSTLRVRARRGYSLPFVADFGQQNAVLLARAWTPLARVLYWADAFAILPEPDYDIVHSFNAVPIASGRPYVLTFEDFCPRVPEDRYVGWLERALQRELARERCVALLALSEYAVRQFRHQNRDFPGLGALEAKLEVRYPPIAPRREQAKQLDGDTLKLLFVGRDFMRKGGPAVLRAHELLRRRGLPAQTTIVSSLGWKANDAYVDPPSPELVRREVARLDGEGIVHHASLPNTEVLRLMEEADFLVFPTLHDTFGFVTLEALACGTPVLASATNALPEVIEDGRSGYLLPLELDGLLGRWAWTYRTREPGFIEAYEAAIGTLAETMADRLCECWESRERYAGLSEGALERVRTRFDVVAARQRLQELYETCSERVPRWRRRIATAESAWHSQARRGRGPRSSSTSS